MPILKCRGCLMETNLICQEEDETPSILSWFFFSESFQSRIFVMQCDKLKLSFPQVVDTYITRIFEDSKLLNIQSLAPFFTESPKSTINSKITQLQKHRHKIKQNSEKKAREHMRSGAYMQNANFKILC